MPMLLTGLAETRPVATTSALTELGCALHVLNEPAHHDAQAWAGRIWAELSADLAETTRRWAWLTTAVRAAAFVRPASGDIDVELARLRALPAEELVAGLLRPLTPGGDRDSILRLARARGSSVAEHAAQLLRDPAAAAAEFLSFVEDSRRAWFGAEWSAVRGELAERARRFGDTVERDGAGAAMSTLDPAVTVSGADGVRIAKVQSRRHDVSLRGLVCVPSARIRPHLHVSDLPGRPLLLIHPVVPGAAPVPTTSELLRRLETAAHIGRLEVARAIATEPRTAGEIAALWGLDATLVNRHLRALAAAGLATTSRHGRFVRYTLDAAAVRRLGDDLLELLLR